MTIRAHAPRRTVRKRIDTALEVVRVHRVINRSLARAGRITSDEAERRIAHVQRVELAAAAATTGDGLDPQ